MNQNVSGIPEGENVIIQSTDADNGKVYYKKNGSMVYMINLGEVTIYAGPKGDKGDPFRYSDFTQAQLDALKYKITESDYDAIAEMTKAPLY